MTSIVSTFSNLLLALLSHRETNATEATPPSPQNSPLASPKMSLKPLTTHSRAALGRPAFSIASLSLGTNLYHTLPKKIAVAAELGYEGIEIFIADFEAFVQEVGVGAHDDLLRRYPAPSSSPFLASSLPRWLGRKTTDDAQTALEIRCAQVIGDYCADVGLDIPVLQPFRDFENLLSSHGEGEERLEAALARAERWLRLMKYMRTDLLLVCSNALPYNPCPFTSSSPSSPSPSPSPSASTSSEPSYSYLHPYWTGREQYRQDLVRSFRALGHLAAQYGVRIGYEALAWGTVVNRWEQNWDVVQQVDLPNVGIILDSFNQL